MARRSRIYFTDKQKADIWDRWQRGESMSSIGRLFERDFLPEWTAQVTKIKTFIDCMMPEIEEED